MGKVWIENLELFNGTNITECIDYTKLHDFTLANEKKQKGKK